MRRRAFEWERLIARYFSAEALPLTWDGAKRRYTGIAGHEIARVNSSDPANLGTWKKLPERFKYVEDRTDKRVILIVNNARFGDGVEDSLVVMRLGTLTPLLKALVNNDKERWSDAPKDQR